MRGVFLYRQHVPTVIVMDFKLSSCYRMKLVFGKLLIPEPATPCEFYISSAVNCTLMPGLNLKISITEVSLKPLSTVKQITALLAVLFSYPRFQQTAISKLSAISTEAP
jgi:hypothetical protein